jgi:flagellar biosynthesis protein FlhA
MVRQRGGSVFDETDVIVRTLEAAVRRRADRLLTREATSRLVESLRQNQPALVEQVVPGVLSIAKIQRTLQSLLREGVPVRPLSELLELMADHVAEAAEPWQLAEIVRRRLAGSICRRVRDPEGRLTAVRLVGGAVESLLGTPGGDAAATRGQVARLVADVRRATRPVVERGGAAVVLVPAEGRRRAYETLARHLPDIVVLTDEDVADEGRVETFVTLGSEEPAKAA